MELRLVKDVQAERGKFRVWPMVSSDNAGGCHGIAFCTEDANLLFSRVHGLSTVICVDVPRSAVVTNVAQAAEFYGQGSG